MAIITAQADGAAEVVLDAKFCNACGLCLDVCPAGTLRKQADHIEVDSSCLFGCMGCGACMVICPRDAIHVQGRGISPRDIDPLPARTLHADYEELLALMEGRRSCRVFVPAAVSQQHLQEILVAAATAPVSVPPSGVGVVVLQGVDAVQAFRRDLIDVIRRRGWLLRAPIAWLWRPFVSRTQWRFVRSFVQPMLDSYLGGPPANRDGFFHDAPTAIYFYSSETSDPADAPIAATHAMLAAESLGYGTCFLGFPGLLLTLDRKVGGRYGVPRRARAGITLLIGAARMRTVRTVRRHFARLNWLNHSLAP